ncbi:MAG: type III-A CRISPR-associated RAMP protein Csm5 [Candidatus Caldatribacteriaceae bacterium]
MKVTVKTITPVCVRSGKTLSSFSDFVIAQNRVHFIDKTKLENLFRENIPLMQDFTKMALRGEGSIALFLRDHRLSVGEFLLFSVPLRFTQLEGRSRQLHLPVLSSQGVYLPGSSLKGMLRSALLFAYFQKNGTALLEEARSVYIGENVFRKDPRSISQDVLRFVRVSDSTPVPFEGLAVYELKRLTSSPQGRGGIPLLVLAVPPNAEFSFTLQIDAQFERADIPDFWKRFLKDGEEALLRAIRSYTEMILRREIEILQHLPRYRALLQFYYKVEPHLPKQILFRLGFGKTYFFNSVGCFLSEDQLRKLFGSDRRIRLGPAFPSTRFVVGTEENQIPLGWLVVTKTQE